MPAGMFAVSSRAMYVKTTTRRVKGGQVRYLHLAHNEWDAAARRSVPKLLYSFGREDQLDKDAVRRLVASLARLLDPGDALPVPAAGDLAFSESRPYGGAYVLDALWNRLGIGSILSGLRAPGRGRPRDAAATERVLFGLVAVRALAPSSKLATAEWMGRDVHTDGLAKTSDLEGERLLARIPGLGYYVCLCVPGGLAETGRHALLMYLRYTLALAE